MRYNIDLLNETDRLKHETKELNRQRLLEHVISAIKEVFGHVKANEVYVTGSLIVPGRFNDHSDIDIAVKGLADSDYFPVLAQLSVMFEKKVELIEMETCRFADKIEKSGLRIL